MRNDVISFGPDDRGGREGGPGIVAAFGSAVGAGLTVLGVVMILVLAWSIFQVLRSPEAAMAQVDAVEHVLRGTAERHGAPADFHMAMGPDGSLVVTTLAWTADDWQTSPTLALGPAAGGTAVPPSPVLLELASFQGGLRLVGIILMLMLLGTLVRLAIALITAGQRLMALANPYEDMFKRAIRHAAVEKAVGGSQGKLDYSSDNEDLKI